MSAKSCNSRGIGQGTVSKVWAKWWTWCWRPALMMSRYWWLTIRSTWWTWASAQTTAATSGTPSSHMMKSMPRWKKAYWPTKPDSSTSYDQSDKTMPQSKKYMASLSKGLKTTTNWLSPAPWSSWSNSTKQHRWEHSQYRKSWRPIISLNTFIVASLLAASWVNPQPTTQPSNPKTLLGWAITDTMTVRTRGWTRN